MEALDKNISHTRLFFVLWPKVRNRLMFYRLGCIRDTSVPSEVETAVGCCLLSRFIAWDLDPTSVVH